MESQSEDTSPPAKRLRRSSGTTAGGPAPEKVPYPKKRVNVACQVCRQRKTKCDAVRPTCGFCADIGASCVYRIADLSDQPACDYGKDPTSEALSQCAAKHEEVVARLARIEDLLFNSARLAQGNDSLVSAEPASIAPFEPVGVSPEDYRVHVNNHTTDTSSFTGHGTDGSHISTAALFDAARPAELLPLCQDTVEEQLEFELFQPQGVVTAVPDVSYPSDLDLSTRSCWQTQQAFLKDVLPWCPILDQQYCSDLVFKTAEQGLSGFGHESRLTFFILALGCIARDCHNAADDPDHLSGIGYFRAGCAVNVSSHTPEDMVRDIQGFILQSFYLLHFLRPIQAYQALRQASEKVIILLRMSRRLGSEPDLREAIHRAFWACYLFEHELQQYLDHSALVISKLHENAPLPMSSYDEPGIYWLVAEAALRRIVARPLNGICWNLSRTRYEPAIGLELSSQVDKWHESLPPAVAFPLPECEVGAHVSMRLLLDPHKVFLRAQYFAFQAAILWPNVVRLLCLSSAANPGMHGAIHTMPSGLTNPEMVHDHSVPYAPREQELSRLREAARRCVYFAVIHAYAVEPLLQTRHLFLLSDIIGVNCLTLLLLCTYRAQDFDNAVPAHPQATEAIRIGRRCLQTWEANPPIQAQLHKIESLMREKGITLD